MIGERGGFELRNVRYCGQVSVHVFCVFYATPRRSRAQQGQTMETSCQGERRGDFPKVGVGRAQADICKAVEHLFGPAQVPTCVCARVNEARKQPSAHTRPV